MSRRLRRFASKKAFLFVGFISLAMQPGCLLGPDFRKAAIPSVQSGTSMILDGLLDGFFAAIQPQPGSDNTSSSDTAGA